MNSVALLINDCQCIDTETASGFTVEVMHQGHLIGVAEYVGKELNTTICSFSDTGEGLEAIEHTNNVPPSLRELVSEVFSLCHMPTIGNNES